MQIISDFKKLNWFYRNKHKLVVLYFVTSIIEYAMTVLVPKLFAVISDNLIAGKWTVKELNKYIIITFIVCLTIYPIRVWREYMNVDMGVYAHKNSIKTLYRKFMHQDMPFFNEFSVGQIVNLLSSDIEALQVMVSYGNYAIASGVISSLVIIFAMINAVGFQLSIFAILPFPILVFVSFFMIKIWDKYYEAQQEEQDKMSDKVLEDVGGVRVIRAYHAEERSKLRFQEAATILRKAFLRFSIVRGLFSPICKVLSLISYAVAIFLGFQMAIAGQITIGNLMSFFIYMEMLIWPVISISDMIVVLRQASDSMDRINKLLKYKGSSPKSAMYSEIVNYDKEDIKSENKETSSTVQVIREIKSIDLQHCFFKYPNLSDKGERFELKDVCLKIEKKKVVAVVGPVGSGKSTLLKLFLRIYSKPQGEMMVNGYDIDLIDRASLRERIAYVPQNNFLFSTSIQNNILLAEGDELPENEVSDARKDRLDKVVEIVDLKKDLVQFPHGLLTQAGEKGIALSGGQKQRISLARALFKSKADLLILDDCLSAVDGTTEAKILANLRSLDNNQAMLISAHRFSAVMYADEILLLDNGKIVARGKHEDLLRENKWYRDQAYHQAIISEEEYLKFEK